MPGCRSITLNIILELNLKVCIVKPISLIGNIAVMNDVVEHINSVGVHGRINRHTSAVGDGDFIRIGFLRLCPIGNIAVNLLPGIFIDF